MFQTYDPAQVVIVVGTHRVQGFATDSMVDVERNEELYSMKVGADGEVSRARNRNRSGKVTIRLAQESPSNDALNALAVAGELSGADVVAFSMDDLNSTTMHKAEQAWVQKYPTSSRGKESGEVEWVINCADLTMGVGGQLVAT